MKGFLTIVLTDEGKFEPIVKGEMTAAEVIDMCRATEKFFIDRLVEMAVKKEGQGKPNAEGEKIDGESDQPNP